MWEMEVGQGKLTFFFFRRRGSLAYSSHPRLLTCSASSEKKYYLLRKNNLLPVNFKNNISHEYLTVIADAQIWKRSP